MLLLLGQNVSCERSIYAVSYLHVGSVLKSLSKHQVLPVLVYYFIMFHSLTSELRTSKDLQGLWPLLLFLLCYVNLTCCVFFFFYQPARSCCWGSCGCCWLQQTHVSISIQKVPGSDHSCLSE